MSLSSIVKKIVEVDDETLLSILDESAKSQGLTRTGNWYR